MALAVPLAELDVHHRLWLDPIDLVIGPSGILRTWCRGQGVQCPPEPHRHGGIETANDAPHWLKRATVIGADDKRLQQTITGGGKESHHREVLPPRRVDLQPVGMTLSGTIRAVEALGDDTVEPLFPGGIVEGEAVMSN